MNQEYINRLRAIIQKYDAAFDCEVKDLQLLLWELENLVNEAQAEADQEDF